MKNNLCLLGAALLLLAGCDTGSSRSGQEEADKAAKAGAGEEAVLESANGMVAELSYANAGMAAPVTEFADGEGNTVSLSDFRGKPVLLNLWATWCAPCKAEMPTLDALAAREEGRLAVVAVSQDLTGMEVVAPYLAESGLNRLKPYVDTDTALMQATGAAQLPTTILYDSNGQEVWRVTGGVEWDDEEVRSMLAEGR